MENNQKNSNILDDVAKETETEIMSIINEGFEQARKIIEDSENRTKIDINDINTLQKKESEILSRQILGTAEIEKRNTVLKIIEKNINKVFITALKELNKNKDKNYQKSLNSFLTEGVVLLDDSILYVSCNKKDRQLIKKIIPTLSKQYDKEIKLNDESIDTCGGVIIRNADSSVSINNTIEERLERMKPELRTEIVKKFTK